MLTEKQMEKYAEVLIWALKKARTQKFGKGDIILVRYDASALRLAEILFGGLVDLGMNPVMRGNLSHVMERDFMERANNRQLVFLPPGEKELMENLNGGISLLGPVSITHLSGIDPKRIGKIAIARKHLREILIKREEDGEFGWTLCAYPTDEPARRAKLTTRQYAGQIVKACFLNKKSPVSEWQSIYKQSIRIKKWLNGMDVKYYHVESENVDLRITPGKKRQWIGLSGHNIPSFEIFLSPDWRGTAGKYYADQPSYRTGNYVEGVRLEFEKGAAVKIEAEIGEDFVRKQLAMDRGANRLGEFSLTDKRFSNIDKFMANTLFDENFGGKHGNCHIAVGASYSDTYSGDPAQLTKALKRKLGFNDSALHWDLVNTEKKTVTAHLASGVRTIIYENGSFTI